jgi:hypothetical protein
MSTQGLSLSDTRAIQGSFTLSYTGVEKPGWGAGYYP